MNLRKISRRQFITASFLAVPALMLADAHLIEPTWLKIRHLRIGTNKPEHRFVHFTDVHHKGDRHYLEAVINYINALSPDFVCFTGDIVEDRKYFAEALELFGRIKSPLYGVPGNHDYLSKVPFGVIKQKFMATGGDWLVDENREIDGRINLVGTTCMYGNRRKLNLRPDRKNILLMHYPAWIKTLKGQTFDLVLAGHSHGGQVRIPFYGPLIVPYYVDEYNMGLYQTESGPLYVNPGIGYIDHYNIRFNCHPEITVIQV